MGEAVTLTVKDSDMQASTRCERVAGADCVAIGEVWQSINFLLFFQQLDYETTDAR